MRPMELSLTGFRSYPNPVTVDFTGKSLAAVLGDTGAGKSSLLEAITYALFRKSSWDANEAKQLIADGAEAMSVTFTFLHGGHRWRVHRTLHATNPNACRHHLHNLDTDEEDDTAKAVDGRIETVLQMGYKTFLRVGLLPQGKFDQLLTAAPKERTERLRELFGTDALSDLRQLAVRQRESLNNLLMNAKIKRDSMFEDPAQTAVASGEEAQLAEEHAERMQKAIGDISGLQSQATNALAAVAAVDRAALDVTELAVSDAMSALDALEPVAAAIAACRESLSSRDDAADERNQDLTAKIDDFEARGEDRDALVKAATFLKKLPTVAREFQDEHDRLAALDVQLDTEATAIAIAEQELVQRIEQTEPIARAAKAAKATSKRLNTSSRVVRARVTEVAVAAQQIARTAQARGSALGDLDTARQEVELLAGEHTNAASDLETAQSRLDATKTRNLAAGIAAELHLGDDCPVCMRQLQADFEPTAGPTAAELRTAQKLFRDAKSRDETAQGKLAIARATLGTAETTVSTIEEEHRKAQQDTRRVVEEASQLLAEFASFAQEAEETFDAESATATLTAAVTTLAAQPTDDAPAWLIEPITAAIDVCEQAVADRAERQRDAEINHKAAINAARVALNGREEAHEKAVKAAKKASATHKRAATRITDDIRELPARIQSLLPANAIDITADTTTTAAETVAGALAEVKALLRERDTVQGEKNTILVQQRELDQEARDVVEEPLNALGGRLKAWAAAAAEAATHLSSSGRNQMPEAPTDPGVAEIRNFAVALASTCAELTDKLTKTSAAHSTRANEAKARLVRLAATLADIDGFEPDSDLTAPHLLHPLVAARATDEEKARSQRSVQSMARQQVKPAADLDFAIGAGQARLAALDVLRSELVDAKFLGHLTGLSTRALLGVASDLLGKLTDQRFGFGDRFDIISRGSGVAHTPNRLSGGEKFLASLALALALAELHSRGGPRLGSLFLDEGFAALDTAALQTALDVLHAQAGGDRLVMVISHLHAVAEAVDDVLWVERGVAGSTARWLSLAERDELVQADLASGLQTLA